MTLGRLIHPRGLSFLTWELDDAPLDDAEKTPSLLLKAATEESKEGAGTEASGNYGALTVAVPGATACSTKGMPHLAQHRKWGLDPMSTRCCRQDSQGRPPARLPVC